MDQDRPSLDAWLSELKAAAGSGGIGIYLMHNGVVRVTSKGEGRPVSGLELTCDRGRLSAAVAEAEAMPGVTGVRVWVNEGSLAVGDDMIYALVAGDVRSHVVPAWTHLVKTIRTEVVTKREILA